MMEKNNEGGNENKIRKEINEIEMKENSCCKTLYSFYVRLFYK